MLLRRSPQNPCYVGILAGEDDLRPTAPSALGFHVTNTYSLLRSTVSACRKSTARIPAAWACRNCRQVGPERRGAGSMPAACRISQTVDGATVTPSLVSSPWIRRCPHSGFSVARRTTRRAIAGIVGGRPGLRRLLVSYLPAASL